MNPSALLALLAIAPAASALEFELLWAQMVDDEGQFDVDLPTPQSCENAAAKGSGQRGQSERAKGSVR